ncbi:IS6 family transposase [Nitrosomonas ureae]|uniref:Transposase (Or an inactivated derivative) n=1 Tax=Nitrosomonas ureae TaxID=44577 RepID=A0A286AL14_9PROT|nr:IS6 family transposase [Nitrosomonas ureae]SOD22606.1 Transposase (or an inactivated derivative) [Nitrosomonas ureae]
MSDFKWRHYQDDIILGCVRWYCKYGISYRDLEEMMLERGFEVDHTTIYRWVQHYAPEMEKRMRWYWKPTLGYSWRVDETYVKVKGKWTYLYRAVDKHGNTIDFYLSSTRNKKAAKRFLGKALKSIKPWAHPQTINTDKAPTFGPAIDELKEEGKCPEDTVHRQVKYLNNIVEADHGKLKRLINPVRGFKSMKTAYATIKGFELMHMFRKGQMDAWKYGQGLIGEIRLIERQFNVYSA